MEDATVVRIRPEGAEDDSSRPWFGGDTGCREDLPPTVEEVDTEAGRTIDRIAGRGFTLGALLEFFCVLLDPVRALDEIQGLREAFESAELLEDGQLKANTSFFDVEQSTTGDVARNAIVPLTSKRGVALASAMTGGRRCFPICIITHTWANRFAYTVAAAVADAEGKQLFWSVLPWLKTFERVRRLLTRLGAGRLGRTVWICAVSVNQHLVVCQNCPCGQQKVTTGDGSEIGAFDKMMARLDEIRRASEDRQASEEWEDFYQLIAVDHDVELEVELDVTGELGFTVKDDRVSAIQEDSGALAEWHKNKPPWKPKVRVNDQIVQVNGKRAADAMNELCAQGQTKLRIVFRRDASVLTRIWVIAEVHQALTMNLPQRAIQHFPVTGDHLHGIVDVNQAEATSPDDREMILGQISDPAEYNSRAEAVVLSFSRDTWKNNCVHRWLAFLCSCLMLVGWGVTAWEKVPTSPLAGLIRLVLIAGMVANLWHMLSIKLAQCHFKHLFDRLRDADNLQSELLQECRAAANRLYGRWFAWWLVLLLKDRWLYAKLIVLQVAMAACVPWLESGDYRWR